MSDDKNKDTSVFIGGASQMQPLLDPLIYDPMLETGNIGLYGHVNGVYDMVVHGQMQQLTADWAGSAPGVAELGMDMNLAQGQVTVENTTGAAMVIPVGTLFSTADGKTFQLLAYTGQPGTTQLGQVSVDGYVSGGTAGVGHYILQPGQQVSLWVEGSGFGNAYNVDANAIVASSVKGLKVLSSTATSGGDTYSDPELNGRGDPSNYQFLSPGGGDIEGLFHAQGYVPSEADVNVGLDAAWTDNDLVGWKGYVDNARAEGILNVAPIWSANGLDTDYTGDFATSAFYANVREAALYGGGLSFDAPPWFFNDFTRAWFPNFGEASDTYVNFIEQQIRWANSEGLRTSIIISPNGTAGGSSSSLVWDNDLLASTKAMVARLQADGAMPSQFIVEQYDLTPGTNIASETDPNGLNQVALYLATVSTVATTSESNLEVAGQPAADMIANGIVSAAQVASYARITPYADAVVGTTPGVGTISLKLTLSGGGTLSDSAGGQVSADGLGYSISGSAAQIQAALRGLTVANTSTAASTQTLTMTMVDADSSIGGSTSLGFAASPRAPTISGLAATATVRSGTSATPLAGISVADPTGTGVTAIVSLSDPGVGTLMASTGASPNASGASIARNGAGALVVTGSASAVSAALAGIAVDLSSAPIGTQRAETVTVTVASSGGSTSANSVLTAQGNATVVIGLVGSASVNYGASATPFSTALLSVADPTGQVTVKATLSGGGTLSDHLGGTVSADGLSYSFTGTGNAALAALWGLSATDTSPFGGQATLSVSVSDATASVSGAASLTLGAESAYSVGDGFFSVAADPRLTATIATAAGSGSHIVFGGGAALDYTGGNTTLVFNGTGITGAVHVSSLGGNVVWGGAGAIDYRAGGHSQFILGDQDGISSHVSVSGGSASDSEEFDVWGRAGTTQTVGSTGPGASVLFGGGSNTDFTGGNATVVLNGSVATGQVSVHSTGNDYVWSGSSRVDFFEGAGDDTIVGGSGLTVIHGADAAGGTTDFNGVIGTGGLEYDGAAKDAAISVNDGTATVFAGQGLERMILNGAGKLLAVSGTDATGTQEIQVAPGATGNVSYWGGAATAILSLGGGYAFVQAGTGNTTLTAGSGSLHLDLSAARQAAVAVDGSFAGDADVYGYAPGQASVTIHDAVSSAVSGGSLVVNLQDGHRVTFHGVASTDGIHFT